MMNGMFLNKLMHKDTFLRNVGAVRWNIFLPIDTFLTECESPKLDHAGDIDYIAKVGSKALGIQIKPVTAKANFGNYSATERMKASFADFELRFCGKVFVVFSLDGEIANKEVVTEIKNEIERLKN